MSLCVDCILFTLKGKPVKDNKYIQIFIMWLSVCWKNGGLDKNDVLHIKIDSDTFEYIKNDMVFTGLQKKQTCQLKILLCPPPVTMQDGMMMKYIKIDYEQDIYMYCDIDVLIMKPLKTLTINMKPNTIYVHSEGLLGNHHFNACFTEDEMAKLPEKSRGFSAGKFIIYGKNLYTDLLSSILKICCGNSKIHYTVEQPFFNKALYGLDTNLYNVDRSILVNSTVSQNLWFYSEDTTVLLDAAGFPGDGEFHFDKILNLYIMINSGIL